MAVDFKESRTKESQARNRYTFGAQQAKKAGLYVVSAVFQFTANQEKEHGEIFYNHLKKLAGETITVNGGYPVDIHDNVAELLRAAQHNEYEEYEPVYKTFGDIARQEGFTAVSHSFYQIADIEKTHGDRFGRFADLIEQGFLFTSANETSWICLNCGHIVNGLEAPKRCPVCRHDQGYFYNLKLNTIEPSVMC